MLTQGWVRLGCVHIMQACVGSIGSVHMPHYNLTRHGKARIYLAEVESQTMCATNKLDGCVDFSNLF